MIRRKPSRRWLRMTPEERVEATLYERQVRELGCIVCRLLGRGYQEASIHHCRHGLGLGQRGDYTTAIPLAPPLHQLHSMPYWWPWRDDVPIHAGDRPFRERYGVGEEDLLRMTLELLEGAGDGRP
jgi:hypothetical protein